MAEFLNSIKAYGLPGVLLLMLHFCIKNPDKVQIWISLIERYVGLVSARRKRKNISNEIEGRINLFAKKTNNETGDSIFPYGIKMQWVEDSSKDFDTEAFTKKNQVIIKMKPHENQDRNLAVATLEYVSRGLIPKGRFYVSKNIMRSIDFKMVYKILLSDRLYSAVEYFFENMLSPEITVVPEIKEHLEKMHNLDDHGLFTSILLFELMILGKKIPPDFDKIRRRAIAEVKLFILFLNNIAMRAPEEETELHFIRKEIRVSLLLIARAGRIWQTKDYLWRFKKNLEEGSERVYITAMGANIRFAKMVSSEIEKKCRAKKLFEKISNVATWRGGITKGYICLFQAKN